MPLPLDECCAPGRGGQLRCACFTDHDREEVLALCDRDPVTNVFVSSRIRAVGMEPARLGGQVWGYSDGGQLTSLCYSGANLVPVAADSAAIAAYRCPGPDAGPPVLLDRRSGGRGDRAVEPARTALGPPARHQAGAAGAVDRRPAAGRARPAGAPGPARRAGRDAPGLRGHVHRGGRRVADRRGRRRCVPDPGIRADQGRAGRSPGSRTAGSSSRRRSALSRRTPARCRASGCRRRPAAAGTQSAAWRQSWWRHCASPPIVSLYVNDFNTPARAAYRRVGFTESGTFMSVLF